MQYQARIEAIVRFESIEINQEKGYDFQQLQQDAVAALSGRIRLEEVELCALEEADGFPFAVFFTPLRITPALDCVGASTGDSAGVEEDSDLRRSEEGA